MNNKKLWKKIVLIFLALTLFAGSFSCFYFDGKKELNWQAYTSKDQRFKAEFPADPKETSKEMEVANNKIEFNEPSATDKDSHFAVSYVDFPGHWKWLGTKKLLSKSFEMFIENEKGIEEILQQELTTHNGDPALLYRFKQDGKEIKGKFIISGNTLYRIAVTYPLAAAEKIKPENFLDSLEVQG